MRDAGEIEQIIDEQGFELDISPENVEVATRAIGNVETALEGSDGHEYRGEWGA